MTNLLFLSELFLLVVVLGTMIISGLGIVVVEILAARGKLDESQRD